MSRLTTIVVFSISLWILGLVYFTLQIPVQQPTSNFKTDGIVVLTGSKDRVIKGIELLIEGRGDKLLISGVGNSVSLNDLKKLANYKSHKLDEHITLGYYATNTRTNADETDMWMELNNYMSLQLVTSDYHVPRSLIEFKVMLPNVQIIPYPVFSDNIHSTHWWKSLGSTRLIMIEYHKYLASYFWNIL